MSKGSLASYRLMDILLLDSLYKRDIEVDLDGSELENDIDIGVEDQVVENRILVTVTLSFYIGTKSTKGIESKIKMLGIFECPENPELAIKDFGKINGPAIIFPFIREHLATVSMKSGIAPILLPPMNFVKLSEEKKKEKAK